MTSRTPSVDEVLAAAAEIVAAFAATDGERYFATFDPQASFVFHVEADRLDDRAAYERLWSGWIADGWRVTSCESTNPHVQVFPGGAVFAHDVATSVETSDGADSYRERETIVFRVEPSAGPDGPADPGPADPGPAGGDRLVAVHEHLSPNPTA
ncbi:nuclear transport factor 2 family protein [Agromyces sp. LHK192]|uniref:nuclear transport factor 2 family protein n=1 Tax=Agromyces sp. LHK192 TaxID=2498704 RepID=UPI000FDA17C8|nr:nuclear transport factor 2 family protein [Agromyces sp. LHK192]